MPRRDRPASTGLILAALLLAFATSSAAAGLEGDAKVKAPNFRSKDLDGEDVVLEDLLGRGPIVVDFWATWCKPCIKELPYVQRMHDELSEEGLQVLAVTIDSPKTQSRVRPFIKSKHYGFRVVLDASQDVFRKLQGKGSVPYVVVLDREGYIRYRHTGYRPGDEQELEKVVRELLAEDGESAEGEAAENEASS